MFQGTEGINTTQRAISNYQVVYNNTGTAHGLSVPSVVSCCSWGYFWIGLLFFTESFCPSVHSVSAWQPFPRELPLSHHTVIHPLRVRQRTGAQGSIC